MQKQCWNIKPCQELLSFWIIVGIGLSSTLSGLQAQEILATVKPQSIQIGQELEYTIQVETDSVNLVVFPDSNGFSPLEVLAELKNDTIAKNGTYKLLKTYVLTQFDSGKYTIPRQKLIVADRPFFTDSIPVEIQDVLVDTTKQKMYPIKPLIAVKKPFTLAWKKGLLWGIPIVLIGLGVYFFLLKKKKAVQIQKEQLPAYEKAMLALQQIDNSNLIEKESHKEYYSQLSDTARKYIDEEVYDKAMESTTDELIQRLEEHIKQGSLSLEKQTVADFKKVLITADLAKFAKSKPDIGIAKADRQTIEKVIQKTKAAIPEPTEEELLADKQYQENLLQKQKKKRWIWSAMALLGVVLIGLLVAGVIRGFDVLKDDILGHPIKELAENPWITSSYGAPPISISTPEVLIRSNYALTEAQKQTLKGNETFAYGGLTEDFYILISSLSYVQQNQVDLQQAVEGIVGVFEAQGAKNISLKEEEYETLGGAKGIKVFGTMEIKNPDSKAYEQHAYQMLNFGESGGFQQITITYKTDNRYAEKVANRILTSVEFPKNK